MTIKYFVMKRSISNFNKITKVDSNVILLKCGSEL